jgi:DNA polymerase III alpha subunit
VTLKENWIKNTGSEYMFKETWEMIQSCIAYGFCSAHAAATSLDMCYGAYLKVNHPLEYYTVCFNNYLNDEVRTGKLKKELDYFGINLLDIKFRHSKAEYSFDRETNSIYKGVASIKFLNENASNELYNLKDIKYNSFIDLLYDIKEKTSANSRQLDILIKLDYFSEFGDINKLLKAVELFELLYDKSTIKKDKLSELNLSETMVRKYAASESETRVEEIDCQKYLLDHNISEDPDCMKYKYIKDEFGKTKEKVPNGFSTKKTIKKYQISTEEQDKYASKIVIGKFSEIDMKGLLSELFTTMKFTSCSVRDKLTYQKEHLGYINMKLRVPDTYYCITLMDGKFSNKMLSLYQLKTGNTVQMKVKGKTLEEYPLNEGDIINVLDSKDERKWGRKDGEYYKKDEYETILKKYNYVR